MSSSFESFDVLLAIPAQERVARALAAVVVNVLPVPRGSAGASAVVQLLAKSITYTVGRLVNPTDPALQLQEACNALARCLSDLEKSAATQRPLLVAKESNAHPTWRHLLHS